MKCLESTSHFYYSTESTHAALNGPPRAEPLPYATPFPLVLSSSHRRFRGLFCLQSIAGFFAFGKQSLEGNFMLILFPFSCARYVLFFYDIATGFPSMNCLSQCIGLQNLLGSPLASRLLLSTCQWSDPLVRAFTP